MAESFYTLLTSIGQAKIANSQVTGQKVDLVAMAVGDGAGSYYNPTQTQTALRNEVWRGNIASVSVDENNPTWIVIDGVIPSSVGGFFVREVGIFDAAGDMIAIGKYPETYKPLAEEGSAKDLYIRMIIEVTNASAVQLKIDPSVIIASRKYVDDRVAPVEQKANQNAANIQQVSNSLTAHLNDYVKHPGYGVATGSANAYMVTLNPAPSSYIEGMAIAVKINTDNTGPSTININNLGAKPIKKPNGNDVSAGNLKAGSIYTLRYNGTNFILQGEGGSGNAQPQHVLSGYTFTNDSGEQTGTMPNRGAYNITPGTSNITIPAGYHNGSGVVYGDPDLIPSNIRQGVNIFGVVGTLIVDLTDYQAIIDAANTRIAYNTNTIPYKSFDKDKNFILMSSGYNPANVVFYDKAGNLIKSWQLDDPGNLKNNVVITLDGQYVYLTSQLSYDYGYLTKYDSNGNRIWSHQIDTNRCTQLATNYDGSRVAVGRFNLNPAIYNGSGVLVRIISELPSGLYDEVFYEHKTDRFFFLKNASDTNYYITSSAGTYLGTVDVANYHRYVSNTLMYYINFNKLPNNAT